MREDQPDIDTIEMEDGRELIGPDKSCFLCHVFL